MRKTQIPDFRHYAQTETHSAGEQRAVLWVPRRADAEAVYFSTYAAKLISGISRRKDAAERAEFSDVWKKPSLFVDDAQK